MAFQIKPKKAKSDFTEDGLPSNRAEVFFDVIKIRFGTLIKAGLILLLFALPLLIVSFIKDSYLYSVQSAFSQGDMTEAELSAFTFVTDAVYYVAEIICIVVFGVGLSGVLRVIRRIVWGEPVFFAHDLIDGIRMQGGRYALYTFFLGLLNCLGGVITLLDFEAEFIKYIPFGINFAILLPPLLFALVESQIYNFRLLNEYKNGAILYLKTFFKTILATVILCLPLLFGLIEIIALKYIVVIVFFVFVLPLLLTGEFLYFNAVLDKYVNKETYPEIYDKGIRRKAPTNKDSVL